MDPFIIVCIILAVGILTAAAYLRIYVGCKSGKSSDLGAVGSPAAAIKEDSLETSIYNPGYNDRALAVSPSGGKSAALLRESARLSPYGRSTMMEFDRNSMTSPITAMIPPGADNTTPGYFLFADYVEWMKAFMVARDKAEKAETEITGVKPSSYTPVLPKMILPRLEDFSEQSFYDIPTKMIPMEQEPKEHQAINRYRNILPYNAAWVQLTCEIGLTKDRNALANFQYVNANYIPSYDCRNPKEYIASQGPKEDGLPQFWRMIWQEQIRCIAMLTGLVEKNRAKCAKYWPDVVGSTLSVQGFDIKCTSSAREGKNKFITTQLLVTAGKETRMVTHFWFDVWPDLGVPTWKDGLSLRRLLAQAHKTNIDDAVSRKAFKSPLLVHCSAGIGRTGVLIAFDHALHCLERDGNDKFDLVADIDMLRNFRGGMVQTWQQAVFVLQLLEKAFKKKIRNKKDAEGAKKTKEQDNTAPSLDKTHKITPVVQWTTSGAGAEVTDDFI